MSNTIEETIKLVGSIKSNDVEKKLKKFRELECNKVLLDFTEVSYIESSALTLLLIFMLDEEDKYNSFNKEKFSEELNDPIGNKHIINSITIIFSSKKENNLKQYLYNNGFFDEVGKISIVQFDESIITSNMIDFKNQYYKKTINFRNAQIYRLSSKISFDEMKSYLSKSFDIIKTISLNSDEYSSYNEEQSNMTFGAYLYSSVCELAINSTQHSGTDSYISLEMNSNGKYILISIADNGIGFYESMKKRNKIKNLKEDVKNRLTSQISDESYNDAVGLIEGILERRNLKIFGIFSALSIILGANELKPEIRIRSNNVTFKFNNKDFLISPKSVLLMDNDGFSIIENGLSLNGVFIEIKLDISKIHGGSLYD